MASYNREKKYQGYDNKDIHKFNKEIFELRKQIRELEEKIQVIRDNCDHEFEFWSSGMYEDFFCCKHCGEETER